MKESFIPIVIGILCAIAILLIVLDKIIWAVKKCKYKQLKLAQAKYQAEIVRLEKLNKPKRWVPAEIIMLAYIVTYDNPDNEDFIWELAKRLDRTVGSVQRKLKRLEYPETDEASELDKAILKTLQDNGSLKSLSSFKEACQMETGNTQWVWKYINQNS